MRRLGKIGQCASLVLGTAIGTFCFLALCTIFIGKPIRDTILSAHGILTSNKPVTLTTEQTTTIVDLVQKGALISSSDLLSNMTSFYSTVIQLLIAIFFVFGSLSFFAIRAHSRSQIEEVANELVSKSTLNHFGSVKFQQEVRERIDSTLQIALEDIETRLEPVGAERIDELEKRLRELRDQVLPAKPEDE